MSWVEILKGPKWDNMIQQILNDEFPIHDDYVLYSRLMGDNKKTVDYYLKLGRNVDKEKQKELFRLILGEMRRDNNFNYWMEDREREDKILKSRPRYDIPHTLDKWYNILENPKSANKFRKEWGKRKNTEPNRGTLGKAKAFLNKPKETLVRELANYILAEQGTSGREADMQRPYILNNLRTNYDLIEDVIQEIRDKPDQREGIDFVSIIKNYIAEFVSGDFTEQDWDNFEQEVSEHFGRRKHLKDKRRAMRIMREKLSDVEINKIKNHIPDKLVKDEEDNEKLAYENLHQLFETPDFKDEIEWGEDE